MKEWDPMWVMIVTFVLTIPFTLLLLTPLQRWYDGWATARSDRKRVERAKLTAEFEAHVDSLVSNARVLYLTLIRDSLMLVLKLLLVWSMGLLVSYVSPLDIPYWMAAYVWLLLDVRRLLRIINAAMSRAAPDTKSSSQEP